MASSLKLRIDKQGNVGLGTLKPLHKLHVGSGDVNITVGSSYCINNVSILNSTALGNSVVSSQLQTLGNLSSLNVFGDVNRPMANGVNWISRSSAADNDWSSVAYGNGLFVAVANTGVGNRVMTSPDDTWTIRTSAADNSWLSVIYGNGLFVAVANSGTGNRVMTSPDGLTWTSRTSTSDITWTTVT